MDLLTRRFSAGDVIKATDVSNPNLQSWMKRGIIAGHAIDGGGGPGRHRSFTWMSVMEIAIASALIELGVSSLQNAFRAAQRFSHTSDGPPANWDGDHRKDPASARLPGFPFHHARGETYLYVAGDRSAVLVHDGLQASIIDIERALRAPIGYVALNVSKLFMQVSQRLGLHGFVVLDAVYGLAENR